MKIATWNVNGIRAREAQLCEWLERDQPDVVCLQELKAEAGQIPERCKLADYHVRWHGMRAYSGVSLHVRRSLSEPEPAFGHPDFDIETRIVQVALDNLVVASVYVPNGGKDYAAKLDFLSRLAAWAAKLHDEGRELILCGDMNVARRDVDVHPRERAPASSGSAPRSASCSTGCSGSTWSTSAAMLDPDNERLFTWWPPWRNMRERNIGWRIDYILASPTLAASRDALRGAGRGRDQRPRAGGHDDRVGGATELSRSAQRSSAAAARSAPRDGSAGASSGTTPFRRTA